MYSLGAMRALALLVASASLRWGVAVATPECQSQCTHACEELNGDIRLECGGCTSGCHPGASGFWEGDQPLSDNHKPTRADARQQHDIDRTAPPQRSASAISGARQEGKPQGQQGDDHQLQLLKSANCPEILPANGQPGHHTEDDFGAACVSMAFRDSKWLRTEHSTYQRVEIFHSAFFGHILTIDGALMITERDEANYHEMLAHVPLAYLPEAKRVLIIGGGDGGTVTQVAQHTNLREIVWVELDELVVKLCREYFPHLFRVESDPRVELRFEDGAQYVAQQAHARRRHVLGLQDEEDGANMVQDGRAFDVILVDSTDFNTALPLLWPRLVPLDTVSIPPCA